MPTEAERKQRAETLAAAVKVADAKVDRIIRLSRDRFLSVSFVVIVLFIAVLVFSIVTLHTANQATGAVCAQIHYLDKTGAEELRRVDKLDPGSSQYSVRSERVVNVRTLAADLRRYVNCPRHR